MPLKVLISGGGTGGHIFPAIAIANEIRRQRPDTEFLFVGAKGKMEMEKVPAAGYDIIGLNIQGIQRRLTMANLSFPFKLVGSLLKARAILFGFKPDVVVGVGGFASGPVLRMATWMKIPTLIQEQNSFAGITNRWVGKSVQRACVAYDGMERFFPASAIMKTGNPVRKEVVQIEGKREAALNHFGLSAERPVVLIIGGSLGARSINLAVQKELQKLLGADLQLIWQTGKHFSEGVAAVKRELGQSSQVFISEFIYEMDLAYAAADLVVSRAGAIAVSELTLVAKPTILVPFPHAAEDHQTKNAMSLVERNAAVHIGDADVSTKLLPVILELIADSKRQQEMIGNIKQLGMPEATEVIAKEVMKLERVL